MSFKSFSVNVEGYKTDYFSPFHSCLQINNWPNIDDFTKGYAHDALYSSQRNLIHI